MEIKLTYQKLRSLSEDEPMMGHMFEEFDLGDFTFQAVLIDKRNMNVTITCNLCGYNTTRRVSETCLNDGDGSITEKAFKAGAEDYKHDCKPDTGQGT